MSAIAFVTFDGFYIACLVRSCRGPGGQPLVVLKDRRVLDSCAQARKYGVRPGITAPEARYAARGHSPAPRFIEFKEEDYAALSRSYLNVCAEYASAVEPVSPHCAFLDLSLLPGARQTAHPLAADIYHAVRLCPQIGIAGSRLTACLAAECTQGRATVLPPGGDARFLAPLPIETLWTARPEILRRLRHMGYRTVGAAASLPAHLLKKHFGDEGLRVSQWAKGIDRTPVRALYPPDEVASALQFPQPARLSQEIEAGLRRLAERLSAGLRARDRQASEIELEVGFEGSLAQTARRSFTRPIGSFGALLTGLRLTLRKIPLDGDIQSLSARLHELRGREETQMRIADTSRQETDGKKQFEHTMKRLKGAFGENTIRKADEIPLPRRVELLKTWREATGWIEV
ncbi:MAG: hypothetical protein IH851_03680 [Armatimonadetes bacterium]|nr:hypothetical protein [Armatimonadota bacterium]